MGLHDPGRVADREQQCVGRPGRAFDERPAVLETDKVFTWQRVDPTGGQREREPVGDPSTSEFHQYASTLVGAVPEETDSMIPLRRSDLDPAYGTVAEEAHGVE